MGFSPFDGFGGVMFNIVPIMVAVIFVIVITMIIVRAVKGAARWKKNNDSPVLTVDAKVTGKRADVSHHHHGAGTDTMQHMSSSTTYFATFEVPSGDRMELVVSANEYAMLSENDTGKLTFQGTRYLGFERVRT